MKWLKRIGLVILILSPVLGLLWLRMEYLLLSVPTSSMEDTVVVGDHLWMRGLNGAIPERGELVAFTDKQGTRWLKRVVGVAGDRVRIHEKKLFVNGAEVREGYVKHIDPSNHPFRDEFPSSPKSLKDIDWAAYLEAR